MVGLSSTTAAGLARRFAPAQLQAVESGVAAVTARVWGMLPATQAVALCQAPTIDLDATDVEVYGRLKRGVADNHQGQRVGRPHVAIWAEAGVTLAADLLGGNDDPRAHSAALLGRALAGLPVAVRAGTVRMRADAGYFAGELVRAAVRENVEFAIGAKRIAPLWRCLSGIAQTDWVDAVDMTGVQVAVTDYRPHQWPETTRLLIRRVALDIDAGQVSGDPRSRRRRTLHPDQRALPLPELAKADAVYAYSFVMTNIDVSTPERAATTEHWYRHRTEIENVFRDSKHGGALRHLPSGYPEINTVWMWGALLTASIAGWCHQLTATTERGHLVGHGVRGGKAMVTTLRHRLIAVPARVIPHAGALSLRLPPDHQLLTQILTRIRALPRTC